MAFMTTIQKSNSERSPKSPDFGNPTTRVVGLLTSKTIRVIAVILLAGLIGAGYFAYSRIHSQNSTSAAEETQLQTATATVGDLVLYANGTGTIIPATESSFGFNSSGQVSEIYVQVGERVEAGDVVLTDATALDQ